MKSLLITNATVITSEEVINNCSIQVENGIITRIGSFEFDSNQIVVDAKHSVVMPGIIDIHTDALEMEIIPRPAADIPVPIALRELERKMSGNGFTTVFHSLHLGYNSAEKTARSKFLRKDIFEIVYRLSGGQTLLKNKIHLRFELSGIEAYDTCFELIDKGRIALLSVMDHTPGQGQYSKALYIEMQIQKGKTEEQAKQQYDEMVILPKVEGEKLANLIQHARAKNIEVASHDDDTVEKVKYMKSLGVNICEFPINLQTARYASQMGMHVVGGASNVLRGGSLSGNLSVLEAVKLSFINTLCSDYYPPAILHAVWKLAGEENMPWNEAVNLASLNPSKAVNLHHHTGSIEVGKNADIIIVKTIDGIPLVTHTIVDGNIVSQAAFKSHVDKEEEVWL